MLSINLLLCLVNNNKIIHFGDKAHKTARRLKIINSIDELYKNLVCEWPNPNELVIDDVNPLNHNEIMLLDEALPRNGMDSPEARMMYWDIISYMTDDILCKVDRAAMGTSLETRVPFLDHRVAELAWQIPTNMKIKNGQGKWPLREILYKRVPQKLIERPKAEGSPILRAFNVIASKEHGRGQHQHQHREDERRHSNRRAHAVTGCGRGVRNKRHHGDAADQRQTNEWDGNPIGRQATTPQIKAKSTKVPKAAIKM